MVDAVVLSGSGYAGAEVLRLLADHPHLRVVATTAHSAAGHPVRSVHPHLPYDLVFTAIDDLHLPGDAPLAIFGCGAHVDHIRRFFRILHRLPVAVIIGTAAAAPDCQPQETYQ